MRVKIHRATSVEGDTQGKSPGEVIDVSNGGVLIATGSGALWLSEVQLPLGKGSVLSGRDILNSRSDIIFPGAKFN